MQVSPPVVESEQDVLLDLLHRRLLSDLCIPDIEPHEIRRIAYLCAVCQRHSQQQDVPVDEDVSDLELHAGVLVLQSQVQGILFEIACLILSFCSLDRSLVKGWPPFASFSLSMTKLKRSETGHNGD